MTHWTSHSECVTQGADLALLAPGDREPSEVTQANEHTVITTYCNRCTVRLECLLDALDNDRVPEGVWGGLTQAQRIGTKRKAGTGRNPNRPLTPHVIKALEEMCDEREQSGRRVPASRSWPRSG